MFKHLAFFFWTEKRSSGSDSVLLQEEVLYKDFEDTWEISTDDKELHKKLELA